MFLEDITKFSELGAQRPIFLWQEEFIKLAEQILPTLERAAEKMDKKTQAYAATVGLVKLLREEKPNEYKLAANIGEVSKAFTRDNNKGEMEIVERLNSANNEFIRRARTAEAHRKKRQEIKATISAEENRAHDRKLFETTGLVYCLEYYLAIYKAIIDQPTEEKQKGFIEQTEVDLGAGSVPGVRKDMKEDEVLEKFILLILDDDVRNDLTKAYYSAKMEVMKEGASVPNIVAAIKGFNQELLRVFQKMGIERLTSSGFTPYGFQPRLNQIKL